MSDGLTHLFDEMIEVLQQERRAVASLEVDTLNRLTETKVRQLSRLQKLVGALDADAPEASDVRARVLRVSVEAQANALLVRDALDVVRTILGDSSDAGVYDARGAIQPKGRQGAARSI